MRTWPYLLALMLALPAALSARSGTNAALFEASLVNIEVSRTAFDYQIPWTTRNEQTFKNGIVISGKRVLTTADGLPGQYLLRVRKNGATQQYIATLDWVDYHANLAVLRVAEASFWDGMKAVQFASKIPTHGNLEIHRWRNGRIEVRAAEIERLYVGKARLSYLQHLQFSISSEIGASGWAEVVAAGRKVVGLTASSNDNRLVVLPAPLIETVLKRHRNGDSNGLAYFDFDYMPGKNPALLRSKGLEPGAQGIVVTEVGRRGIAQHVLKKGDVILEIDGFDIDTEGYYVDPDYGRLKLHGLATRGHVAGESLSMRIWRGGEMLELDYALQAADFSQANVPDEIYDERPQYLIKAGLLFQPLTGPYMESFGKNKPILLRYYVDENPLPERNGLVLLTAVLPDPSNISYQDLQRMVVDQINGIEIASLADVEQAFSAAEGDYHQIRFTQDQGVKHMVMRVADIEPATLRVLERYAVPDDRSMRIDETQADDAKK